MLKIRLRRMGARNAPFYRVILSDSRKFPTATAVEELGYYDPKRTPAVVVLDHERVKHWVGKGAQLSKTVERLRIRSAAAEGAPTVQSNDAAPSPSEGPTPPAESAAATLGETPADA